MSELLCASLLDHDMNHMAIRSADCYSHKLLIHLVWESYYNIYGFTYIMLQILIVYGTNRGDLFTQIIL